MGPLFGQVGSVDLVMSPPKSLCILRLFAGRAMREAETSLNYVSTGQQQLKYQCVINIVLILNPKQDSMPTTKKRINSVLAESRTKFQTTLGALESSPPLVARGTSSPSNLPFST